MYIWYVYTYSIWSLANGFFFAWAMCINLYRIAAEWGLAITRATTSWNQDFPTTSASRFLQAFHKCIELKNNAQTHILMPGIVSSKLSFNLSILYILLLSPWLFSIIHIQIIADKDAAYSISVDYCEIQDCQDRSHEPCTWLRDAI